MVRSDHHQYSAKQIRLSNKLFIAIIFNHLA
jgi:hypothetical protein